MRHSNSNNNIAYRKIGTSNNFLKCCFLLATLEKFSQKKVFLRRNLNYSNIFRKWKIVESLNLLKLVLRSVNVFERKPIENKIPT